LGAAGLAAAGSAAAAAAAAAAAGAAAGSALGLPFSVPGVSFLDFEFDNMYDGCIVPVFETVGINNPCPNIAEGIEIAAKVTAQAGVQIGILTTLAAIGLEWIDECGLDQECYEKGTGWSFVWAWNAAWMIIMGLNFIVLAVGSHFWWPRFVGTIMNCCFGICHLVGIIFMIMGATSPFARICFYNKSTSSYKGDYEMNFEG